MSEQIYFESSLTGDIISTKRDFFENLLDFLNLSIVGSENASVFPYPVLSLAITFSPLKM